eukprot:3648506-Rhodomonas_salina.2
MGSSSLKLATELRAGLSSSAPSFDTLPTVLIAVIWTLSRADREYRILLITMQPPRTMARPAEIPSTSGMIGREGSAV